MVNLEEDYVGLSYTIYNVVNIIKRKMASAYVP